MIIRFLFTVLTSIEGEAQLRLNSKDAAVDNPLGEQNTTATP